MVTLLFFPTGLTMYSVDSGGLILAWNCMAHEKPRKDLKISWTMKTVRSQFAAFFYSE